MKRRNRDGKCAAMHNGQYAWRTSMKNANSAEQAKPSPVYLMSKSLFLACALATLNMSPVQARSISALAPAVITLNSDPGGSVYRYMHNVALAAAQDKVVQIQGRCQSACTLYLAMPSDQICVHPNASFSFHQAYGSSRASNELGTRYMLRKYPQWVRSWIREKGGLQNRFIHMSYSYVSKFVRTCGRTTSRETQVFKTRWEKNDRSKTFHHFR